MTSETVAEGLALLRLLDHDELTMKEVMDRLELLTTNPEITREILDEAEREGIIERDVEDGVVEPVTSSSVDLDSGLITKTGEFTCERCGQSITTGYFMEFDTGTVGPFGSTCVRKVTGRE